MVSFSLLVALSLSLSVYLNVSKCQLKFHIVCWDKFKRYLLSAKLDIVLRLVELIFRIIEKYYPTLARDIASYLCLVHTYTSRRCWKSKPETTELELRLFNCFHISFSEWSVNEKIFVQLKFPLYSRRYCILFCFSLFYHFSSYEENCSVATFR